MHSSPSHTLIFSLKKLSTNLQNGACIKFNNCAEYVKLLNKAKE